MIAQSDRLGAAVRRSWTCRVLAALLIAGVMRHAAGANKNGVAPNQVTLPSGPGSIRGLGENFEPDLSTGTARYSFKFALPATPGAALPDVPLEYNGGNGDGPLGIGWKLFTPFVQRKVTKPLPRYVDGDNGIDDDRDGTVDEVDERDRFVSELHRTPNMLVPGADAYYFGYKEGDFVRYARTGDYWEATEPNGNRLVFGRTAQARESHPDTGIPFKWKLEQETDPNGNTVRYFYAAFPGEENANRTYLRKIEYGPGAPPWENFHFMVFNYEVRPDFFENNRGGFVRRTGMRLIEVAIGTQGPTLDGHAAGDFNNDGITDHLNHKYVLAYEAHEHWTLLTSITEVGADNASTLPPLVFSYRLCDPPQSVSAALGIDGASGILGSENTPPQLFTEDSVEITELNGDGLPDLLKTWPTGGAHTAYLNLGEAEDASGRFVRWGSAQTIGGDPRVYSVNLSSGSGAKALLSDLSGDGRADLAYRTGPRELHFFENGVEDGQPLWGERRTFNLDPESSAPPSPVDDSNVLRADINGDIKGDLIQSVLTGGKTELRIWLNLGGQRYAPPYAVAQDFAWLFSYAGVKLADFNGDGLPDAVRITPTQVEVAAGLGYGRFAPVRVVPLPETTLNRVHVGKAVLRDITGSGLPALLIERAAPGELWYWINRGNYALGAKRIVTGLPAPLSDNAATRWADLNGNGTTDLVYADDRAEPRLRTIDVGQLLGCVPSPNLLVGIDNGIGRYTEITHETSTRFQLADAEAGAAWPDPMPFPMDIVSAVVTHDSLGHAYRREFAYHNGYYNPDFRLFAGFGGVEERILSGDSTAPPVTRRLAFDVGREVFALRGALVGQAMETADGAVFWEETTAWDVRLIVDGVNGVQANFPHPASRTRDIIETGAGAPRRIQYEFEYDDYGNEVEHRAFGVVDGDDRGVYGDERIERTEFAINEDLWFVRLPARREVLGLDGQVLARTEYYYDDETFSGANFGQVTQGRETLVRQWRDPDEPEAYVAARRMQYDDYGNAITLLGPLAQAPGGVIDENAGHVRRIDYDPLLHLYPIRETVVVGAGKGGLVIEAAYDEGFGTVLSSTDFNGNTTEYGYDTFARLVRSVRPGDTQALPTMEYEYVLAAPFGGGVVNYVETRLLDRSAAGNLGNRRDYYGISRSYVDGLGRVLQQRREAAPAPGTTTPRVAVSAAVLFNGRGGIAHMLQPFFSEADGASLDALLAYENVSADGWAGSFHMDGALERLTLTEAPRTRTEYDALERPVKTTNADGTFRTMAYAPLVTTASDENDVTSDPMFTGTPVRHYRDGLGRLVRVDEIVRNDDNGNSGGGVNTWTTRYAWRHDGRLTRITDSQGNQKWFEYDGLGRKAALHDINQGETRYTYDDAGNLVETADALNRRVTYTYDGANRLLTEDYHDEGEPFSHNRVYDPDRPISADNQPDVAYHYDAPAGEIDLGNGTTDTATGTLGQLAYVIDLAGETHFSYDARGNTVWAVKRMTDPRNGAPASFRTAMDYDSMDRLTELVYPDGDRCTYAYNERNLLAAIGGGASANLNGNANIVSETAYAPSGQRVRYAYGNGVETTYAYDARGRLKSLRSVPHTGPDDTLIDYRYDYDGVSNITRISDNRPATLRPAGDARRNSQSFAYDSAYRVTSVTIGHHLPGEAFTGDGRIQYRYDPLGNMLRKDSAIAQDARGYSVTNLGLMAYGGGGGTANRIGRAAGDPPGPHALTSAGNGDTVRSFAYDGRGNITEMDGLTLTWDYKDRLVSLEDHEGMRAEYVYDYTDRRAVKKVWEKTDAGEFPETPARATQYIDRYFEVRDNGQPTKYVFEGGTRVAKATGTLDASRERVQRFCLNAGWNLAAIAVDAADAAAQLGIGAGGLVDRAFLLDTDTGAYTELDGGSSLPPGSLFWVKAAAPAVVPVRGAYTEPGADSLIAETGFLPYAGLERLNLADVAPDAIEASWGYSGEGQTWQIRLPGDLDFLSDLPDFVLPGQAVYLVFDGQAEVELPSAPERIQYYHPDHLGSSSVVTDAEGHILEETTYYPFGEVRHQFRAAAHEAASPNRYLFSQKERDEESNLQYFEARYLAASLGRFNRVDPAVENVPMAALENPQLLHAYAYARNNPVALHDPDGRFVLNPAGRTLFRQLRPFSDQATGNFTDTKLERRARVFGTLRFKKGEEFPDSGAPDLPAPLKAEANKLKLEESLKPNALISSVTKIADGLTSKFPQEGKNALNASAFVKRLTKQGGIQEEKSLLGQIPGLLGAKDFSNSPVTETGKIVEEKAAEDITRLQNTLKSIDLNAKYNELIGKVNKSGKVEFQFDQKQVDKFIDQYLELDEDAEEQNRERKREEEENED